MIRTRCAIGVVTAAVLACAGCAPAPPPLPQPPPQAPQAPLVLAPRPAELRLDGVDPCAILTAKQRADLGLDGNPTPYTSTFEVFGNPKACSMRGYEPRAIAVDLAVVTTRGIDVVIDGFTDQLTPITVGGFPAVLATPRNPDACVIDIDVAAGQMLEVTFADGGRKPQIPQDQLCRDVPVLAEAAMTSLLAR